MGAFFAAAGKFDAEWLVRAALSSGSTSETKADVLVNAWGLAYCHGNRLESIRVNRARDGEGEIARLAEIKTDMALFYLHDREELTSPRLVQPFIRKETGANWAFCYLGELQKPERFISPVRYPDSSDPGELFFMYVLDRLDPAHPVESIESLLAQVTGELGISFALLSPDMLIVAHPGASDNIRVWWGRGDLVRMFSSVYPGEIYGIDWVEITSRSVFVISRQRRSII